MRGLPLKLPLLTLPVLILLMAVRMKDSDSPHGSRFTMSCSICHSPKGWELDPEVYSFDHNTTRLPLAGQHVSVGCRDCHPTLVFSDAGTDCVSCHTDMHYQTVGPDCARCHTPESWIVKNITEIHLQGRFPLFGPHFTAECVDCHPSASLLRFEPLGIECFDCHREDYAATENPNHALAGISTDCLECHLAYAFEWGGPGFNHFFFPLTEGHALDQCSRCHTGADYFDISPECVSCHLADYNSSTNPSHLAAGLSTDCLACHTTLPGWKPAEFGVHDSQFFPIYSGKHRGQWNSCLECHPNADNYALFTCIDCHEHNRADMDDKHLGEVPGYQYNSLACLECHPTGSHEGN